jgi:serine/threonine-protein kinase
MAAERFRREARAAAKISGEHMCKVMDVGTLANGVPYMVMEYLDGHDLASELALRGRLPFAEAVRYVLQACEAVGAAHAQGVIHRDLKPANLFLERCSDGSRRIKVLDFGVSKSLLDTHTGQAALTQTTNLLGSPLYMSPEQLDSAKAVDPRSDIWSLGVVLYELIAGETPFVGDSIAQLVTAVLWATPRPLSERAPGVPAALDAVLARALAKTREQRIESTQELARALAPFAEQASWQASSAPPKAASLPPSTASDAPPQADRPSRGTGDGGNRPPRRAFWGALLLAFTLAGAAYGWLYHSQPSAADVPAPAQTAVSAAAEPAPPPELDLLPLAASGSEAPPDTFDESERPRETATVATEPGHAEQATPPATAIPARGAPPPARRPQHDPRPRPPRGITDFGGRR